MITPEVLFEVGCSAAIFVALWFILDRCFFRHAFALLDEREARTYGDEEKARELAEETKKLKIKIDSALREARLEGLAIRDDLAQRAKQEAQQIIASAQEKADKILAEARKEIDSLKKKASAELPREVEDLSKLVEKKMFSTGKSHFIH